MSKLYLHDIPMSTFLKYYTSGDINTTNINSNSRYTPVTTEYKIKTYYQYKYDFNGVNYSVNMVYEPHIFPNRVVRKIFNLEHDIGGNLVIPKFNDKMYKVISQLNDSNVKDVLAKYYYYDTTAKKYLFHVDGTTISTVYSGSNKGIITSTTDIPVYYIPVDDDISEYMNHMSLYEYYGVVKGSSLYSIKYVNEKFYFELNEISSNKLDIETTFNVTISKTLDSTNTYYPVYNDNIECGKIYKLQKYNTLTYNADGNVTFKDNYTGNNKAFNTQDLPLSPLVRYNKMMREQKESSIQLSDHDNDDSLILPYTNYLYLVRYKDRFNLEFSPTYYKSIYYPYVYGMNDSSIVLTGKRKTRVPLWEEYTSDFISSTDTNYNELLIIVNGALHLYKKKCDLATYNNTFINDNTNNVLSKKIYTTSINNNEISNVFNSKGDFVTTQHRKIIFSTNDAFVFRKYDSYKYGENQSYFYVGNGIIDSETNPYLSYGIYGTLTPDNTGKIKAEITEDCFSLLKGGYLAVIDTKTVSDIPGHKLNNLSDDNIKHGYISEDSVTVDSGDYYTYLLSTNKKDGSHYITLTPVYTYLNDEIDYYNDYAGDVPKPFYTKCQDNIMYRYDVNTAITNNTTISVKTINGLKSLFNTIVSAISSKTFIDASNTDSINIDTLDNAKQKKSKSALRNILKTTMNLSNNSFLATNITDKYSIKSYVDSIYKNIAFSNLQLPEDNKGGLCTNRYNNKTYNGFINYTDNLNYYITSQKLEMNEVSKSVELDNRYDYLDTDIDIVKKSVEDKNYLDRLFNYKKYTINAEEIYDILDHNTYKNKYDNISTKTTASDTYQTESEDSSSKQYFDLSDIKEKVIDLYTEFLYQEYSNVSGEILVNDDDFYKRNYDIYIDKVLDENNQFIYTNNNNYNLKYVFNNNLTDKSVFISLLKSRE